MSGLAIDPEDLSEAAAVIDYSGRILGCNQEWRNFVSRRNFLRQLAKNTGRLGFRELLMQLFRRNLDHCVGDFAWSETRWVRASARVLKRNQAQCLIRLEDISAQMASQVELQRLKSLLEQLPEPVFFLNPGSGETVYANPALLEMMEIQTASPDLRPVHFGPIFDPESLPKLTERLAFAGSMSLNLTPRTSQGRRFPARLDVMLLKGGPRPLLAGVMHNHSERRRQLAALQSTSSRLQAILESAPVAIITFTLEGLVSSWNPAAQRIFGWAAEEVVLKGSPFPDYLSEESVREVIENGSTIALQLKRRCKDGGWIDLSLSVCPLLNEMGLLTGLLEVAEDVTDRVNQDLLASNQAMLESREAERLSLAREIHDGPLQELMVIGFSLAEARQLGGTAGIHSLTPIQQAVVQVAQGLRAVVSRLRPAGLQEFGLVPSLQGAVARLSREYPDAPETTLDLENIATLTPSQELCLFRIVQEGYQNCLRHARPRSVTISLRQINAEAELLLQDDGLGFCVPSRLSELADSEHYGLLGIQERTLLSGGSLVVDSQPGKGTRIRVLIPLR